ncbi:Sperm flagellar protein 1, partial [Dryobates pubescens]
AEVKKFFFPTMVQLHSYVPSSSTPQKLANWGHLNRKVLSKLNFCVPEDVVRQVVQSRPGTAEQVLLLLRQKIEEKQKQSKVLSIPGQANRAWGKRGIQSAVSCLLSAKCHGLEGDEGNGYMQHCWRGHLLAQCLLSWSRVSPGDTDVHLQLAEREQALRLAQETIQILQLKVARLEQLLQLKNVRIDDLSRRLQQAQCHQQ